MSEDFSTQMQDRLWEEIDTLRAELERVRGERDEYVDAVESTMSAIFGDSVPEHYEVGHLPVHVMALLATIGQLRQERDVVEAERDAARQAAGAWKQSTKMWRGIAANLTPWDIMSLWKSEPPFYDEGKSRKHRGVVND